MRAYLQWGYAYEGQPKTIEPVCFSVTGDKTYVIYNNKQYRVRESVRLGRHIFMKGELVKVLFSDH